jgi:hypothetical protein
MHLISLQLTKAMGLSKLNVRRKSSIDVKTQEIQTLVFLQSMKYKELQN